MTCCSARTRISRSPCVLDGASGNFFVRPRFTALGRGLPYEFVIAIDRELELSAIEANMQNLVAGDEPKSGNAVVDGDLYVVLANILDRDLMAAPGLVEFFPELIDELYDVAKLRFAVFLNPLSVGDPSFFLDAL